MILQFSPRGVQLSASDAVEALDRASGGKSIQIVPKPNAKMVKIVILTMDGVSCTIEAAYISTLLEVKLKFASFSGTPSTEQGMFALYDQREVDDDVSLELSNYETVSSMLRIAGQEEQLDLALFTKTRSYTREEHVNMLNEIRTTKDETQKRELLDAVLSNSTSQATEAHTKHWEKKLAECRTDFERREVEKMQAAQAKKLEMQQARGGVNEQAFSVTHAIDVEGAYGREATVEERVLRPAAHQGAMFDTTIEGAEEGGTAWAQLDADAIQADRMTAEQEAIQQTRETKGQEGGASNGGSATIDEKVLRPAAHEGAMFDTTIEGAEEGGTAWVQLDADAIQADRMTAEQEAIQQNRETKGPPSEAAIERRKKKMEARFSKR
jgi:hypothetical protein